MNAKTLSIPVFGLAAGLVLWPAPNAHSSGTLFSKASGPLSSSSSLSASNPTIAAASVVLTQFGQNRNQLASTLGSGLSSSASAFSGTFNLAPTSTSALYAGVTVTLPSPDASVAGQIAYFDVLLVDLTTGNSFSILPMFTSVTLIPNGDPINPVTTAILSTSQFDEMALAATAAVAGGAFQIGTIVVDKNGNVSKDHYFLYSNFSEPAGPILLEQKAISNPNTGELTGASLNYLAGPPIVLGAPPAQGKRLFLTVGSLIGPNEDGSYWGTVQSSDCVTQTAQRCANLYPVGSQIKIDP